MTETVGVAGPARRAGAPDVDRPFGRLALVHLLSMAGDTMLAIALASTLFFEVDPAEGRQKVLAGLLLTMAPFALVGPLIGPAMDRMRGGHRAVVIATAALRAAVAAAMVVAIARDSWLLFPEAFAMLVLAKSYQVARAAVVPTVVRSDAELVEANSKLQVLGGLAGFVAAVPGGLLDLAGPEFVAAGCAVVFLMASFAGTRLPRVTVAAAPPDPDEVTELRSALVVSAAVAMAALRGVVGFVTMLLAFELRGGAETPPAETLARNVARGLGEVMLRLEVVPVDEPPRWYFGVVVPLGVLGALVGASLAPILRRSVPEERILAGALVLSAVAGVLGVVFSGLAGYALLSFLVAVAASAGKQAFDAVVQRDAPDANRARAFARFESQFQVVWVVGALVPVAVSMPVGFGSVVVGVVSAAVAVMYTLTGFPRMGTVVRRAQASRSGKSGTSNPSASSGSG